MTVSHRVGYAGYIYFTFHIENIGEKAVKKVTARYKFTAPDYTISTGTFHAQGFELPPDSSYSYEHQALGNLGYPIKNGATIEVSDISYTCVY